MATVKRIKTPRPGRRIPEGDPTHKARRMRGKDQGPRLTGAPAQPASDSQFGASAGVRGETNDDIKRRRDAEDHHLLKVLRESREQAEDARRDRMEKNARNMDAFMDRQDFSDKQEGQSAEFLPKISTSAEQFSAFVSRGLTQFGDWFSVQLRDGITPVLTDGQITNILKFHFGLMPQGVNKVIDIETVIADGSKMALMESLMVFKVYGMSHTMPTWSVEAGTPVIDMRTRQPVRAGSPTVKRNEKQTWRLCVDLVDVKNYYPDPTGRGLFEIHRVERDIWEVWEKAEQGIYDMNAVKELMNDTPMPKEDKRKEAHRGQNESGNPSFRKRCYLDEYWGTILDKDGKVQMKNAIFTVANDKYIIRRPEPNPYWHGMSIFVALPLVRVPHSVWHKALYDSASALNLAINEIFNLILDGGIAAVWGIGQLRTDYLVDSRQVSGGIPQGVTLAVTGNLPVGAKVYEKTTDSTIPPEAMQVFEALIREFTQAALTNEIKLGSLPPRQVLATEIAQADQSQAVTLDAIIANMERNGINHIILLSWLTILQHIKQMDPEEVSALIGKGPAQMLLAFEEAEIFAALAPTAHFRVFGLSALLSRVRDFQKTVALMQSVMGNPFLAQAFIQKYSGDRILNMMMKQLNINPDDIVMTQEEADMLPQRLQQMMLYSQLTNPQKAQNAQDGTGGQGPAGVPQQSVNAQVNQEANPTTGMKR